MLKHRHIDRIAIAVLLAAVCLTLLFMNGAALGIEPHNTGSEYVNHLFNLEKVHHVNLIVDDWSAFLEDALEETYIPADIEIDGERFSNVGLRTKGNNSLRLTERYGHDRYSLKIEFDHYTDQTYHGLDKFSLDASFQDNSYLKTWLTFDMMDFMGVATPLRSFTWVTVNGQDWGLFLAIEEPEEAFAYRNYGQNHGQLYKPGYKSLADENADVALKYIDDVPDSYDNIFRNAKFNADTADQQRLIESLRILSTGENLETAVDIEQVLRYFTVQVFVVNIDSYLGKNGHNYFLYEDEGVLTILPWDYNLAFATYSLGMPDPVNDAELYINYPYKTPAAGHVMRNRPLYHQLMLEPTNFARYQTLFDDFIAGYFESGHFDIVHNRAADQIAPYAAKDPTAFCSFEDHRLAVRTLADFCRLRAESVRGQLEGTLPASFREQADFRGDYIDASSVWLPDLGEIADLKD